MRLLTKIKHENFLLAASLTFGITTTTWLIKEDTLSQVRRVSYHMDWLLQNGEKEQAEALLLRERPESGPLSPYWGRVSRLQSGYAQLPLYLRILEFDPNQEQTYREVSNLIITAPEAFHKEIKHMYLDDIKLVPGIRLDFFETYLEPHYNIHTSK